MAPDAYAFPFISTLDALRATLQRLGHGTWKLVDPHWDAMHIEGSLWGVRMYLYDPREVDWHGPPLGDHMVLGYSDHQTPRTEEHHLQIVDILFPALGITTWWPKT